MAEPASKSHDGQHSGHAAPPHGLATPTTRPAWSDSWSDPATDGRRSESQHDSREPRRHPHRADAAVRCLRRGGRRFALIYAFGSGKPFRGMRVVEGLAGIVLGVIALAWPGITTVALLYLVAAWAVVTGILEIVTAINLREAIQNEWLLGVSGLGSVLFGVILAVRPGAGALALIWLIGGYAIAFGVLLIALAVRLRVFAKKVDAYVGVGQPSQTTATAQR